MDIGNWKTSIVNAIFSLSQFHREKFGLYHVDFQSPEKTRTPKASAKNYANIVSTRAIDWNFHPEPSITRPRSLKYGSSSSISQVAFVSPVLIVVAALLQYSSSIISYFH